MFNFSIVCHSTLHLSSFGNYNNSYWLTHMTSKYFYYRKRQMNKSIKDRSGEEVGGQPKIHALKREALIIVAGKISVAGSIKEGVRVFPPPQKEFLH